MVIKILKNHQESKGFSIYTQINFSKPGRLGEIIYNLPKQRLFLILEKFMSAFYELESIQLNNLTFERMTFSKTL